MPDEKLVTNEQTLIPLIIPQTRLIDIPDAPPVRLHTLDLARHIATEPGGRRYVVATFNDAHMKRGIVTAIYPQQNGYLTLVRLPLREFSSDEPEQALQRHVAVVQRIQQGKLKEYLQENQK
ncbi:MAG: hypothetical protein NVS2B12_14890 [Ktedonobacteraceae bacterium]